MGGVVGMLMDRVYKLEQNLWCHLLYTSNISSHGFLEEMLPVLLVRLRGLQHCYVYRPMALNRGLRIGLPLLRCLLLDSVCPSLH